VTATVKATMPLPEDDREFLRDNKQVFVHGRNRWMTTDALRAAVVAGRADTWNVVHYNEETGKPSIICAFCAVGVAHTRMNPV
jgi:hypothetical protein